MNKKGDMGFFVKIVIACLFLVTVLGATVKTVDIDLFSSEADSLSNREFIKLTSIIEGLIETGSQSGINDITLELEDDFVIISFYENDDSAIGNGRIISTPKTCKSESCLCLFKEPLINDLNKKNINDKRVVNCKQFKKTKIHTGFESPDYNNHIKPYCYDMLDESESVNGNVYEYKYVCLAGYSVDHGYWGSKGLTIQTRKLPGDIMEIFIDLDNSVNVDRYYSIHTCPAGSYAACVNQKYGFIFQEQSNDFVCKFNQNNNSCEKEAIEPCAMGIIESECFCEGQARTSGFCIEDKHYKTDLPRDLYNDYCYPQRIDDCGDYKTDTKYDSDKYACTFNLCGLDRDCYWDAKAPIIGSLKPNTCENCTEACNCDLYDNDKWVETVNPCNCDCSTPPITQPNIPYYGVTQNPIP
ncbi:hypothetical protein H8D36_02455 [archaeon]|nr:hypothetical protein [archaeon]MBL7057211.1 hypothetical protein [Candidatus Woesearchaeota archaeon]